MPGGFVSARVDLTKVLATYRPIIDMALAQGKQQLAGAMEHENATGLDMTAMLELYFGAIQQVLDSAETLDLAVASGDGEVELGWALTAAAGSPMASFSSDAPIDLRELAGYLDAGSPIAAVFGADMPALMERMQPVIETLMTVYPAPMRDAMTGLLDDFQPLLPLFGSVMAADGAMDEQGMRFVYFLRPTDADALRDGYLAALRSENMQAIGFTPDTIEETEIGGVQVTSLRFDLDTEAIMTTAGVGSEVDEAQLAAFEEMMTAFYGEDGMLLRVASEGDRMIMVLGGDDAFLEGALARLSQKSTGPARGLERAISRIDGANPCFAYHLDLGRLMSGMSTFMPGMPQDMPELPPDISAPMTFYGAVEGRVWQAGALIDVAGFAELIQAVESR
jgi:hypothetical protein